MRIQPLKTYTKQGNWKDIKKHRFKLNIKYNTI